MGEKSRACDDGQLLCVDSESALHLLYRRPTINSRPVCVNVCSTVLAVSEIVQIKESQLFLVKLLPKLDIIFKRKEILHLNGSITPQKSYIFTNLRHTTLQKGSSFPCLVYTVTKETKILQEPCENVKKMSYCEWLKDHELKDDAVSHEIKIEEQFFSYTGTITKMLDARLGVFELDREVRLYIGHIPAVHKYRDLRVGAEITVHNAHHQNSKKKPEVSIYGCMLTSIRVQKIPNSRSEVSSIQKMQLLDKYLYLYQLSQEKLQHLYHICQTVQEKFDHFGRRICDKLITQILLNPALSWKQERSRDYRNYLDEFLLNPHNCCFQHQTNQRLPQFAAVEELFKDKVVGAQSDNLWQYTHDYVDSNQVLLGELDVCQKTGLSVLRDSTGHCNTLITHNSESSTHNPDRHDEKTRHECGVQCDCRQLEPGQMFPCPYFHTCCIGKVVAVIKYGVVCENVSTSICQGMVNNQGPYSMNYVMFSLTDVVYLGKREARTLNTRSKMINRGEKCTKINPTQRSDVTDKPVSSIKLRSQDKCVEESAAGVDIDHMGSHMTNSSRSQRLALHRHTRQDGGVYFCRKTGCVEDVIDKETSNGHALTDDTDVMVDIHTKKTCRKGNQPLSKLPDTLGNVSLKSVIQTSRLKGTCSTNNHKRDILDIPIKKIKLSQRNTSKSQINSSEDNITYEGKSKDSVSERVNVVIDPHGSKGVVGQEEDLEFSDVSYEIDMETVTVVIHRKDALVIEENNGNQTARFCIQGQIVKEDSTSTQVVLMFRGKAAGWYYIIHSGSTYKFSISTELSPLFKNNVANIKVTEKLKKQNRQMFMVVNELADISQIYQQCTNNNSFSLVSPEEPITSVFSGVFKDVTGVIQSRTYIKNDRVHDRTGRNEQVCTRIKLKTEDDESVQIYLKPENFASPLGLVPGSNVCFTRLERRVSQLGNIYWKFIPLSSVTVLSVGKTLSKQSMTDDDNSTAPIQYLRAVWERNIQENTNMFTCVCSVQQIMKVSLKYVCDHCGSMVIKSRCTNVGCFNTEIGRFLARASILVDDGTSVAMVTLMGEMVRDLLLLTTDQWEAIQSKASAQGEIFVQQMRPELKTDMEQFLYQLCDNCLVKRAWTMKLKLKPASKYTELDKMGCDEFGQKTFDTGSGKVTTRCLPFLLFECLHLQSVDQYQLSLSLIAS